MKTSTQTDQMKYIVRDKEILGGAPTIVGTRIPIERLEHLIRQGYKEGNIRKEFPGLKVSIIRGALAELISVAREKL